MKHARFYIRDLFWLTLVAAIALGWWTDRKKIPRIQSELDACRTELSSWEAARSDEVRARTMQIEYLESDKKHIINDTKRAEARLRAGPAE